MKKQSLTIEKAAGVDINPGMIGLFFEDINYAADGGLYAEMIENRSFECLEAEGGPMRPYVHYDGTYAWSVYEEGGAQNADAAESTADVPDMVVSVSGAPDMVVSASDVPDTAVGTLGAANTPGAKFQIVMGSPLAEENPHYVRLITSRPMCGLANAGFGGICVKAGMDYHVTFWARILDFKGNFCVQAVKEGHAAAAGSISAAKGTDETPNHFKKYQLTVTATEDMRGGLFVLCLDEPGAVEVAYVSLFPGDAVAGLFRKDLFEKLQDLHPGFIRFPGGCVIEGNTLSNRYRFKETLKDPWARKNNWNRWAVHGAWKENGYHSVYSHYNQSLGMGYYEYFILCELLGASPLPVLNVGFACQFASDEIVPIGSREFQEFLQDARDLVEFANGAVDTPMGAVRARMGHPAPFGLTLIGVGNEQWQTDKADFFERYILFEHAIHQVDPGIRLIGSAGPDLSSDKYTKAWAFYHSHEEQDSFVYAVDEHFYVPCEWLYENVDHYDSYSRKVGVFAGEYAAHPEGRCQMNRQDANTLGGALAEAAFLTGVERNADVVKMASYAPLFARAGYAQWTPDLIWFDDQTSYGTPSYYVQKMYSCNMGDFTLKTGPERKAAEKEGIYYSLSFAKATGEVIVKVVNAGAEDCTLTIEPSIQWEWETYLPGEKERWAKRPSFTSFHAQILTGADEGDYNGIDRPDCIVPYETEGKPEDGIVLPTRSFTVIRLG